MRTRMLISAAVVAATLTPAAIVTTAAPAEAASRRTWERMAQCEAGGRWYINTGNGYYGGLQISAPTWRAYGGRQFARLPHKAWRKEQIVVAERIKRGQGWGAWPTCSRRLGLR